MEEDHGKAMEEILRGCEFANQLQQLLLNNNSNDFTETTSFVQYLVNNIINSFSNVLFLLDKHDLSCNSIAPVIRPVAELEESRKTTSSATRAPYKRRNTTREKVTETPLDDDGHQWRKYGQKKINNSQYSRNYYRCTHKYDQRCLTTKQVERIQQKPPLYKTTYYGHHTCGNLPNPHIIHDPSDTNSSVLLSFNNTFPVPTKQDCPFLSSSSPSSHDLVNNDILLDDNNCMLFTDTSFDDSNSTSHVPTLPSTFENDHKNMRQCGFLYDFGEFDDDFFLPFDGF
ncbi:WRKY DNA-binding transcription factor 70-like [Vicia villosa]|uniref:WRKY DNA-binding transcription factor 70-like n=1 Tax=Vicia villosa TaxID=3911 RepID=UPI00273AA80C|nr:WRKY DNA-binding transcription factor 70-like [Vicia villosa]